MLAVRPKVSEKAYAQAQNGIYVFIVPLRANKQQVAEAITKQYGVTVSDVRCVIVKGKAVRASRGKRQNPGTALRSKVKKAYVSVSEGKIDVFKEEEGK